MKDQFAIEKAGIQGYEIEYVDSSNEKRPVLVFAHGLGGNLKQWEDQISYFSDRFRVVAFSLPGHGSSSVPVENDAYSIEQYAEVLLELMCQIKVTSCIWIGNSMGGVLGYEVARRQPDLIQHLVTNGTAPVLEYGKFMLAFIRLMDRTLIKFIGYEKYINIAVNASLKDIEKQQKLKQLFLAANPKTIIESHQMLGNYNYLDVLKNSKAKITIMMTPNDKDINKAINRYMDLLLSLKNVRIMEQKVGGHIFNMEFDQLYNQALHHILETV